MTRTYLLGLPPTDPLPRLLIFMTKRDLIRWFIKEVHWATPKNVAYFMEGRGGSTRSRVYSSELSEMLKIKDRTLRLKRIRNQDGHFAYTMLAKTLPTFLFNHDVSVRNIIGKFLHDRGMQEVSFEKPADASIRHQISAKVFPHQPNKVLGACYTSYLENGMIYNRKGQMQI